GRRLVELYGHGLELDPAALEGIVDRSAGVTASFFKDLLRKATLAAVEAGREHVEAGDVDGALAELLHETSALTRVLLGAAAPGEAAVPAPHAWLEGMAGPQ